jgi:outer membrane protein insertion porin family
VLNLILTLFLTTQVITNIDAQTQFTDSVLVIKTAGIKVGDQYSKHEIEQAIRRIYGLRLFETVAVETLRIADGVRVNFVVTEFPILKDVKFFGNRKIKTKELLEKTNVKIGEIVSNQKMFDWQLTIQDLYKEKGYILANIQIQRTEPDSTNKIALIFQIDEGERVRIKQIEIVGNQYLTDNKIKGRLTNREKKLLRKGLFKEEKFKEDLEKIVEIYKENGFLDAKVTDYNLGFDSISGKQDWLIITIYVDEGTAYYIGDVFFEGESILSQAELQNALRIKTGQTYNATKVNQGLVELYSLYSEQGFIYTQITPIEDIRNDTVHIKYSIAENNPAKIRLVVIQGNERTVDKVIRRQISTLPGSIFKRSDVIRSQRDIFNLGFFSDVKLDYNRIDEFGNIDLIYQVQEKSSFGTVGAGISYNAQDKLTGYIELSQPNLFGKGQQLTLKLEKGGSKGNAQISFTEPYLFDRSISAGFNLNYLTRDYDYYDKEEQSFNINASRPLSLDYARLYLGLTLSDAYVPKNSVTIDSNSITYNYIYRFIDRHSTTFSPVVSFTRDSRDYIYNPISGSLLSYSFELSTIDVFYQRHIFDASVYFPMFKKFSLMMRSRLGLIEGIRAQDTIPIYEKFFPGGTGLDGIRGYADRSIGVRQGGYNIGGKALALYSLEYRFRPSPQLAFLAFADAGNTWNSFREFNISNLYRGAGVGVRLEIPMIGLIGFDIGYGFDRAGGGKWEPHFQIGRTF